jgi:ribonuclease J
MEVSMADITIPASPVHIYALGGLQEVGKNTYCIENDDTLIMIDAGVIFPDESVLGIDYIIPDYTHLRNVRSKIKALFITHGHEDHIGAIPYLLQNVNIPVIYAPKLALALIKNKLEESHQSSRTKLVEFTEDSVIKIDDFVVQGFRVTHSIPDAYGFCVDTPQGRIMTTGDFKIDLTPVGTDMNLRKIAHLASEGVDLLLADSTNAEKEGYTPSEKSVISSIEDIFSKTNGRLIISTFSSNVNRIQQIVDVCVEYGRKIVIMGRSMETTIRIAREYGYIKVPDSTIIPANEMKDYKSKDLVVLCTGSQGEPMAALSRIANDEHNMIKILPGDTVVFSSSPIPGNGASVNNVVNQLIRKGCNVITTSVFTNLHASGHPSKQELRLMLKLVSPKYFLPVHGEYRMLRLHKEIAVQCGMEPDNVFVMGNGDSLVLHKHVITEGKRVQADDIYIDGKDITGLSTAVIRDRNILANDGMVAVLISLDSHENTVLKEPEIVTKGFVYMDERSTKMIEQARKLAYQELQTLMKGKVTFGGIKDTVKNALGKFFFQETRRNPMIIPLIMNKM